jgi:hypothetical protein
MSAELRKLLLTVFEGGSGEELAAPLALIQAASIHPQNSNAAVDFQVHSGCCKLSDEQSKLDHLLPP